MFPVHISVAGNKVPSNSYTASISYIRAEYEMRTSCVLEEESSFLRSIYDISEMGFPVDFRTFVTQVMDISRLL
jgi:hypothetical protein